MKVFYYTFGCKVNQYETENIREAMNARGFGEADKAEEADVCIVNSCTVPAEADSKCRQLLRKLRRLSPEGVIVLTGCYAQAFEKDAKELGICDIVTGSRNKADVPELVCEFLEKHEPVFRVKPFEKGEGLEPMKNIGSSRKTRAYIKIQDGCDQYCTYCVIPFARGHICSKTPGDIAEETRALVGSGHKEIILTGINMCCYGKDLGALTLADAAEAACKVQGDFRVRLSSLEPELLTDRDIERLAELDRLCPHFHLALQSGCDKTLKRMGRHYDTAQYEQIVKKLREAFPGCAVSTDIMIGFPGETEEDFEASLDFVKRMRFSSAHVFPYSERQGTAAAKFSGAVPVNIRQERAARMRKVCLASQLEYNRSQVGRTLRVLFERERDPKVHRGHSDEYINVSIPRLTEKSLRRQFADVRITSADVNGCSGEAESEVNNG